MEIEGERKGDSMRERLRGGGRKPREKGRDGEREREDRKNEREGRERD